MHRNIHPEHPDITDEMWTGIDSVIESYKDEQGAVIPVLRMCQEIAGYLPAALIDFIADSLHLPRSQVFGVTSFYSFFSLKPKGRNQIKVCTGTACYVKGIQGVFDKICDHYNVEPEGTTDDRRFSVNSVRCLGACGLAPVMVVNDDVYGEVKPDAAVGIVNRYE